MVALIVSCASPLSAPSSATRRARAWKDSRKAADERRQAALVRLVRIDPAGFELALARGLDRIGPHALDEARVGSRRRPGSEQRLIEQILMARRGSRPPRCAIDETAIGISPCMHLLDPFLGQLGERQQSRACA